MNRRFGYKKSAIIDISMTAKNYFLSRRSSISNKFNFVLVPLKTISKFYLQYYKFPNISIFLIAKECMCFPNRIGASFTGVVHAQSMFDFFISFPYRVFAISGGTTRGNAWDDVSLPQT